MLPLTYPNPGITLSSDGEASETFPDPTFSFMPSIGQNSGITIFSIVIFSIVILKGNPSFLDLDCAPHLGQLRVRSSAICLLIYPARISLMDLLMDGVL